MLKLAYQRIRGVGHLSHTQRGALGASTPDASPSLTDLNTQAAQIEARIRHLRTGIDNLQHLHQASMAPPADEDLATAQVDLTQLQQAVDDFELTLARHLISWQQIQEPFWQAIRYGGLGLVGGWVLHWLERG